MKIRFQADADLKHAIISGVLRRAARVDFRRAEAVPLEGLADPAVLGNVGAIAASWPLSYSQTMEMLTQDEIARLSPSERLALIAQLWDSLDDEHVALTEAQCAELDRRLAQVDEDRKEGVSWAALKAELEERCP